MLSTATVLVWLGIMAFFAGVVAPAAFSTLDREAAGRFVSAVFPRYYAVGAALGALALAGLGLRLVLRVVLRVVLRLAQDAVPKLRLMGGEPG